MKKRSVSKLTGYLSGLVVMMILGAPAWSQSPSTGPEPEPPPPAIIIVPPPPSPKTPNFLDFLPFFPPPQTFTPDIVVPTDATFQGSATDPVDVPSRQGSDQALRGISTLGASQFPKREEGPTQGILIRAEEGSKFQKTSPFTANLDKGRAIVSVKSPSRQAQITTPLGEIAVKANADVLIHVGNPVLRVMNLDGRGKSVIINFNKGPFAGKPQVVAIAPGFEVIAGSERLDRAHIRPEDGFARRHFKVLGEGNMAIQEFSVESVMKTSGLIAQMSQELSGKKVDRIIGDMSKMAAVLNYMNGTQGYVASKAGNKPEGM